MTPRRPLEGLVVQVQHDFLETPALNLTLAEATQRFKTDGATCEAILGALVDAGVLARAPGGAYVRFFPHGSRPANNAGRALTGSAA